MGNFCIPLGAVCLALVLAFPAGAKTRWNDDLVDRAKWKSFGVEDWASHDPMERARAGRTPVNVERWALPKGGDVAQLKTLIAFAEAGKKGYDAVHVSAGIKTPKRPTQMTIAEVQRWIKRTPGQPHAIGRYQIIPSTLRMLIARGGFKTSQKFDAKTQDQMADILLADAGLAQFQAGRISKRKFMDNLALVWAGLPKANGKSAYHGYAGNRATITRKFYQQQMDAIFGS